MSDDAKEKTGGGGETVADNGAGASAEPAARLGAAMSALASGLVPPEGKPLSAVELSELRSLMATGTWRPAAGSEPAADSGHAPRPPSVSGAPLPASEIAAVKTMMLTKPYVPHPMPAAPDATPGPAEAKK